jgi:ATP-dependent Clp protease protease subunit
MPSLIPTIIERWNQGAVVTYDLYSRPLKDRIIFIGGREGAVTTDSSNILIAQLLYLDSGDSGKDISLYINSPGRYDYRHGFAVYDYAIYKEPYNYYLYGLAMSFGTVLLAAGTKVKDMP